jgi:hypothetical protein
MRKYRTWIDKDYDNNKFFVMIEDDGIEKKISDDNTKFRVCFRCTLKDHNGIFYVKKNLWRCGFRGERIKEMDANGDNDWSDDEYNKEMEFHRKIHSLGCFCGLSYKSIKRNL